MIRPIFDRIYEGAREAAPHTEAVKRFYKSIPVICSASKEEVSSFFAKVEERKSYLLNQCVTLGPKDEFYQQYELFGLKAIKDLKPQLSQIEIELEAQTDHKNKLQQLFRKNLATYWLGHFREQEVSAKLGFCDRLKKMENDLVLPCFQQLKSLYLRYEQAIEEGISSPTTARYQTLDFGGLVQIPNQPKLLGDGSSSKVYDCGNYALKMGVGLHKADVLGDYQNFKEFRSELLDCEAARFPSRVSAYGQYISPSRLKDPHLKFITAPATDYSSLLDNNILSVQEKEKIALSFIHYFSKMHQLEILLKGHSFDSLLYKKVGGQFEVVLLDKGSLFDFKEFSLTRFLSLNQYDPNSHTLLLQLKVNELIEEVQKGELQPFVVEQTLQKVLALEKKASSYVLGRLLYAFFTGNFHKRNELVTVGEVERFLTSIDCTKELIQKIVQLLSFQEIELVDDSPFQLTVIRSASFEGFFTEKYSGNLSLCSSKIGNINLNQKLKIADDLLSQFVIMTEHQYIHCDLRSENMLYSHREGQYKATLCDFFRLVNFKKMRETLDPILIKTFFSALSTWTPLDLPSGEFTNVLEKVHYLQNQRNYLSPEKMREYLDILYQDVLEMEKFVLGVVLSELFIGQAPYRRTPYYKIPRFPAYPNRSYSSFIISEERYEIFKREANSKKVPAQISNILLGLLHPQASQRTSLEEIKGYLKNDSN